MDDLELARLANRLRVQARRANEHTRWLRSIGEPRRPLAWPFPRVLGEDGKPVSPVWRVHENNVTI